MGKLSALSNIVVMSLAVVYVVSCVILLPNRVFLYIVWYWRSANDICKNFKPAGIPLDIICESLEHARKGRLQILDHMEQEISAPRTEDDRNRPRIGWIFCVCFICSVSNLLTLLCFVLAIFLLWFNTELFIHDAATMKFSNDVLRQLIGPLGAVKRKVEEETGLSHHSHTLCCFFPNYCSFSCTKL